MTFDSFYDLPENAESTALEQLSTWATEVESAAGSPIVPGLSGGCWLWLLDGTHQFVRALLQTGRVVVNKEGRYLAKLPEFDINRGLDQREAMTLELAKKVKTVHCVQCTYFSVKDYYDPNLVPFFVGSDYLENKFFYNVDF